VKLWLYIIGAGVTYLLRRFVDRKVPDPLAADGKEFSTKWDHEDDGDLQMEIRRAEWDHATLMNFLPRLQDSLDRGLDDGQCEVVINRLGRLGLQRQMSSFFTVMHQGVVTNLEILAEHQLNGRYLLVLRGIGPAIEVLGQQMELLSSPMADVSPPVVPHPVIDQVTRTPEPARGEVGSLPESADGVLRLLPDCSAWHTVLPLVQGNVLGQAIHVVVENKSMEEKAQPGAAEHLLLMRIFAQLPMLIDQAMRRLNQHVTDPEQRRLLHEPTIALYADRKDSQDWTFYLREPEPSPVRFAMEFRGMQLQD